MHKDFHLLDSITGNQNLTYDVIGNSYLYQNARSREPLVFVEDASTTLASIQQNCIS